MVYTEWVTLFLLSLLGGTIHVYHSVHDILKSALLVFFFALVHHLIL